MASQRANDRAHARRVEINTQATASQTASFRDTSNPTPEQKIDAHLAEISRKTEEINSRKQDIVILEQKISRLRTIINATRPMSRLPAELLGDILDIAIGRYQLLASIRASVNRVVYTPLGWLKFLHVCRAWREVALHAPHLWTTIDPRQPDFVKMAIELSQPLPLTILNPESNRKDTYACLKPILEESTLARIRKMSLPLSGSISFLADSPDLLMADASNLCELSISADNVDEDNTPAVCTILCPHLSTLNITGGSMALTKALARPTITHLTWSKIGDQLRMSSLLELLSTLPQLQTLRLSSHLGALKVPKKNSKKNNIKATLPRLSLIELEQFGTGSNCAYFLEHLSFPSTTLLSCDLLGDGNPDEASTLACTIRDRFLVRQAADHTRPVGSSDSQSEPVRTVRIECHPRMYTVRLFAWSSAMQMWDVSGRKFMDKSAKVTLGINASDPVELLTDMFVESQPWTEVTSLYISSYGEARLPPAAWEYIFEALPCVEKLGLDDWALESFLEHTEEEYDEHEQHSTLYPALKCLYLDYVDFSEDRESESDKDLVPRLVEALEYLSEGGVLLEELILAHPENLTAEDLEDLDGAEIAEYLSVETRGGRQMDWSEYVEREDSGSEAGEERYGGQTLSEIFMSL